MTEVVDKYAVSVKVDGIPMYLTEDTVGDSDMTMGPKPTPLTEQLATMWKTILSDPKGEQSHRLTDVTVVPYTENLEAPIPGPHEAHVEVLP